MTTNTVENLYAELHRLQDIVYNVNPLCPQHDEVVEHLEDQIGRVVDQLSEQGEHVV